MLLPLAYNQVWTWVIILLVVVLLFGATKLPALSKSLGQSIRIFRKEVKTEGSAKDDTVTTSDAAQTETDAGTATSTTSDKS